MQPSAQSKDSASTTQIVIDIAIRLGVLAIVLAACFQIVRPFISPVIWGIIYAFSTMGSKMSAILLTIWSVLVMISDGPMKAVLLGRGAAVPMLVIFLGSLGGFMAIGFLGLFIGAVVLSVGYKLFAAWIEAANQASAGEDAAAPE